MCGLSPGGLGTLGTLTACWLSHQAQGVALLLVGRTGRYSSDSASDATAQGLLNSASVVSFTRSDTGCQAEAANLLLPAASGPLLVRYCLGFGIRCIFPRFLVAP